MVRTFLRLSLSLALLCALAVPAFAQSGTVMPNPKYTGFDNNGVIINAGRLCTYAAGTTTPQATYSDVGLTTQNTNPIILDPAGRATVFLSATSYKFVLRAASTTAITGNTAVDCAASAQIWSQDNVSAIPTSSAGVDILCTAGEALTSGQVVYWSDGSGGKNAGQCYKADSANTYSSSVPFVGLVPNSIASGASGAVRTAGQITGLAGLTGGMDYYAGTAGALTATPPTNTRFVGRADSTSSIVVGANPSPTTTNAVLTTPTLISQTIKTSVITPAATAIGHAVCQGRLTLTTVTAVTTADVTAATTLYFTPYLGNNIGLYDGTTNWTILPFAELSIAVPATTSQMYDVFVFNNSGVAALELLAWTNDTTRATALALQNGVLVKTGATTRRYVGSMRTTTVSGQTEDSAAKRQVYNYYNRVDRALFKLEGAASWAYTTATIRQANGSTANQVLVVMGVAEDPVWLLATVSVNNSTTAAVQIGIGVNSTTTFSAKNLGGLISEGFGSTIDNIQLTATYKDVPAVGLTTFSWNEFSVASGTTTWNVTTGGSNTTVAGLQGSTRQ